MKVIKEAKKLHYHELIIDSDNKIQLTWKIINKESGEKCPG
jgi:hypothetical protein